MAVPAAINTSDDPSKLSTTSPSTSTNSNPPPEVVLTPATPSTPLNASNKVAEPLPVPGEIKEDKMKEKEATDSQTALVGQKEPRKNQESKKSGTGSGPIDTLTRKLSGKSKSSTSGDKGEKKAATANTTSEKQTTTPAAASSSTPANTATRSANTTQTKKPAPKKKKRSGFSGFLLKLGCLSADEFEDPEPRKGTTPAKSNQTPGSSASTPAAPKNAASTADPKSPTTKEVKPSTPSAEQAGKSEHSAVAGAVLSSSADEAQRTRSGDSPVIPADQVVVAPHEPTTAPTDETAGLTSSAVQAPGSGSALLSTPSRPSASRRQSESSPTSASPEGERTETSGGYSNISESEIPDESSGAAGAAYPDEYGLEEEYEDDEDRLIAQGGMGIPMDENGQPAPLLRPMDPDHTGRKCLVLDLDETLLHSSFKMLPSADYIVPVEIESQTHNVYVIKRPGVDHFLTEMGKIYEVVVFTASLSKYADPVMDMLDPARVIRHRLFRESCYNHKGNYVKDLSQLGREMESCIIIDNSPASYIFHPNNAVPVSTWFNDPHDTELTDLCPFLTDLATVDDIRGVLDGSI